RLPIVMSTCASLVVVFAGECLYAQLDTCGYWLSTAALCLLVAIPFSLYGLAFALLFRSETAVSAASGFLVIFAFFGNLFIPLGGVLLDIAKFTPLYGPAMLARWPQTEGMLIPMQAGVEV